MSYNSRAEQEWASEQYSYFQSLITSDLIMLEAQLEAQLKLAKLELWNGQQIEQMEGRIDILRRVIGGRLQ